MPSSQPAPIRRNGSAPKQPTSPPPPPTSDPTQQQQPTNQPPNPLMTLLPTPLETLLLSTYPSLLLLGSLFSLLDPSARRAPYNPITQSHPPSHAPNYFARKGNIFNLFFVKIAWFWVTVAYFVFLLLHPSTGPGGLVLTPKRVRGVLRWGLVTMWWGAVTQWFFGPGLVDRGFRITGGACQLAEAMEGMGGAREFVTGQACKAVGGQWRGGHDISGHVFILVLGSVFLGLEVMPALVGAKGWREERRVTGRDGSVGNVEREVVREGEGEEGQWKTGIGAPLVVAGLSWWMLLMTAAYFHTWFEKFTGLLTAFVGVFVVYFLPRALPAMRDIIGMPGV